jgi:hypothetical protein
MAAPRQDVRSDQQFPDRKAGHTAAPAEVVEHRVTEELLPAPLLHWDDGFRRAGRRALANSDSFLGQDLQLGLLVGFEEADCLRVAWRLGLPLRADGKLPVPVCVSAQNPVVGSGFRAFRIHTFRRPIDDDDSAEAFTTSDEVCDDEFGPPGFGLYGVEASGLLEHIADRATCLEAVALARKLAPGLELPDCPIVRRS